MRFGEVDLVTVDGDFGGDFNFSFTSPSPTKKAKKTKQTPN
jgi:hypothetical protein